VGDYPAIYVEDPRIALGQIAREELKRIGCKVVGVTGSVGKSTTKEMISTVLESTCRIAKTPANHNNDIGMPMAVLSMPEDTEVAVLEMGMNHFREIAYLSEIARPDVGVIINVGTMHIEFLGSREGIRKAKMEIIEGMAADAPLLLNGDNDLLRELDAVPVQPVTYFGSDEACEVWADQVHQGENLTFTAHWGDVEIPVSMALEGAHFVADALAAIAVGVKLGVAPEKISEALASFRNMAGRQEIFQAGGYTIIKDCYNAGPESMAAALNVLSNRKGRKIAVLGDMLELGSSAHPEHYKLGRIAAQKADLLFVYGPHGQVVADGAITGGMGEAHVAVFTDHRELGEALKCIAQPGDVLLFKGSRGMHMEISLEHFLK
jgi:UDP-N-acetylmuramoyl-tripeptide--D-alanyl-D-alanine ligase